MKKILSGKLLGKWGDRAVTFGRIGFTDELGNNGFVWTEIPRDLVFGQKFKITVETE